MARYQPGRQGVQAYWDMGMSGMSAKGGFTPNFCRGDLIRRLPINDDKASDPCLAEISCDSNRDPEDWRWPRAPLSLNFGSSKGGVPAKRAGVVQKSKRVLPVDQCPLSLIETNLKVCKNANLGTSRPISFCSFPLKPFWFQFLSFPFWSITYRRCFSKRLQPFSSAYVYNSILTGRRATLLENCLGNVWILDQTRFWKVKRLDMKFGRREVAQSIHYIASTGMGRAQCFSCLHRVSERHFSGLTHSNFRSTAKK